MGRIKNVGLTEEYISKCNTSKTVGEYNDCAVIAISVATGVDYLTVKTMLELEGRKPRKGTYLNLQIKVLVKLGFKLKRIHLADVIEKFPRPHCDVLKNVTTHHPRRFPGAFDDSKTYFMRTASHVLTMKDGIVHDWSINKSLRLISLWEVVRLTEE